MFKPYSINMKKNDIKEHIEWIKDIYRHLLLQENKESATLFNQPGVLLTEIGLINKESDIHLYEQFFRVKVKFTEWDEFISLLLTIDHMNKLCNIKKLCLKCRDQVFKQFPHDTSPKMIDLFCGSGGMSLGFHQSGFQTVFANDIDESCIRTYRLNHPETESNRIVLGDIKDLAETVNEYVNGHKIDLIIGGPPCQGFSNANKQRIIDDPRNKLYKEFVQVVNRVQPTFFVMENVEGMKNIASQVVEDFKTAGYSTSWKIMNAADFGVPQNRKRLIFIGNRINHDNDKLINHIYSLIKNKKPTTLFEAIGDLPPLEPLKIKNATEYESDESGRLVNFFSNRCSNEYLQEINNNKIPSFLYNHKARYNNDRDIEIFSRLNEGDRSDDPKIADIMPYSNRNDIFKDKYFKLIYSQPSKTITAHMKFDCNMYIHPKQPRGLTPREAARIQSYPDDYYFKGPFTKTYMQIGNSVPPLMARYIGDAVKEHLKTPLLK